MPTQHNLTNDFPTLQLPALRQTHPQRLPGRNPTSYLPAQSRADRHRAQRHAALSTAAEAIHLVLPHQPPAPHAVFTPNDGATEKTSALDRARATVYRMHPLTAILALFASGLTLWLQLGLGLALCLFALTAVAGYAYFNVTDYRYSRAGLERHRISMATQLERERMDHETHLKTLALNGLLQLHAARPIAYDEGSVIDA